MCHGRDVRTAVPGPGNYEVTSVFDKPLSNEGNANFGSSVQRVGWARPVDQPYVDPFNVRNVPGPGHYQDRCLSFVPPGIKEKELKEKDMRMGKFRSNSTPAPNSAFNTTDERNCNKTTVHRAPAPWHYNVMILWIIPFLQQSGTKEKSAEKVPLGLVLNVSMVVQ